MLASILPTLVVLGVLIFVHELGHFMACRFTGVSVERFSIGFGPELFHFNWQGTRVSLSLIPFGGFVKPKGETSDEVQEKGSSEDDYLSKGNGAKALIVCSGVLMNIVLAFVIFFVVFVAGRPVLLPVIGELMPGYPAESSGIKPQDTIRSVDGKGVQDWGAMTLAIFSHEKGPLVLEVERGGKIIPITIMPKEEVLDAGKKSEKKLKRIGVKPAKQYRIEKLAPMAAIKESFKSVTGFTVLTYRVLWGLITGEVSVKNIAGPVGIIAITGETAKEGLVSLLNLTAMLSVNLAVINLLPIPALDGGHLFFLLIETITRRRINQKVQERITQAGFIVLMALMVLIVLNDVQNFNILSKIRNIFIH